MTRQSAERKVYRKAALAARQVWGVRKSIPTACGVDRTKQQVMKSIAIDRIQTVCRLAKEFKQRGGCRTERDPQTYQMRVR